MGCRKPEEARPIRQDIRQPMRETGARLLISRTPFAIRSVVKFGDGCRADDSQASGGTRARNGGGFLCPAWRLPLVPRLGGWGRGGWSCILISWARKEWYFQEEIFPTALGWTVMNVCTTARLAGTRGSNTYVARRGFAVGASIAVGDRTGTNPEDAYWIYREW